MRQILSLAVLVAVVLVTSGSALAQDKEKITEAQKVAITREVLQATKPMWAAAEKMDPDYLVKFCHDEPDFQVNWSDGTTSTYEEANKQWKEEIVPLITYLRFTIRAEKVDVLTADTVRYSWHGGMDAVHRKDGGVIRYNPWSETWLVRKFGKEWKITSWTESGVPQMPARTVEPAPLTQKEKEQITNEVKAVGDSLMTSFERLDAEGSPQFYADSPDWAMINADGSRYDYQVTRKAWSEFFNSATSWKWTTIRQNFIVLSKDIVICSWDGKDETILKSGDKITYDPHAYTIVFKKIAGQWKVIYQQDSGIAVTQKATK